MRSARKYMISNNGCYGEMRSLSEIDVSGLAPILDERHNVIIINYDKDKLLECFANYLDTVARIAYERPTSPNTALLTLGFVPLCMFPAAIMEVLVPEVKKILVDRNIPYYELRPSSFLNNRYSEDIQDIWVHKYDAAKFLGCKPTEVRSSKLFKGVVGL